MTRMRLPSLLPREVYAAFPKSLRSRPSLTPFVHVVTLLELRTLPSTMYTNVIMKPGGMSSLPQTFAVHYAFVCCSHTVRHLRAHPDRDEWPGPAINVYIFHARSCRLAHGNRRLRKYSQYQIQALGRWLYCSNQILLRGVLLQPYTVKQMVASESKEKGKLLPVVHYDCRLSARWFSR